MRKWMVLFLVMVLMSPGFRVQAASNDAELAAIKAKIAQLETNYNQLASQIAQNKKAIEEMSKYLAKDMRDRERFFQDAAGKINKTNETIAALTQKQNGYEVAVQEINTTLATLRLAASREDKAEKNRVEPGVADATTSRLFVATKESTQGRKIIRQGSGDSYGKNSEPRRLSDATFNATQESIARTIRQGSGNLYAVQPRKIQSARETSPRFSERVESAESKTLRILQHIQQAQRAQRVPSRTSYNTPRPGPDIADIWAKKDDDQDEHDGFYTKVDWSSLRR